MQEAITNLQEFMQHAAEYREDRDMPVIHVVGMITEDVTIDGTVYHRTGRVDGEPTYRIVPRIYRVLPGGALEITDDHPDSFDVGNDEVEVIEAENIALAVISETMNEDGLKTPRDAGNIVIYPEVSSNG